MSPPTEQQLIRDYLNRLSAAAKNRLSPDDRQALVARTRDFIERNASVSGLATPMEVAALLSRLGDPATLVAREAGILGAGRDETTVLAETGPGGVAGSKRHRLRRRRSGQASWHWPLLPGSPAVQGRLLSGERNRAEAGSAPAPGTVSGSAVSGSAVPAGTGSAGTGSASTGSASTGSAGANGTGREPLPAPAGQPREPPIWVPRQSTSPEAGVPATGEPDASAPDSRPTWPSTAGGLGGSSPPASTAGTRPDGLPRPEPGVFELHVSERVSRRIARTSAPLITSTVRLARRQPVEAIAAVLLGLGGAIFPPVWLAGVIVALASRAWDYRDKWIGLGGPVLVLVIGTVAGVSLGASHPSMGGYVHEGWVYADVLSRVGAVLGTAYLVWRLGPGRREPPSPPWAKPHKVG